MPNYGGQQQQPNAFPGFTPPTFYGQNNQQQQQNPNTQQ